MKTIKCREAKKLGLTKYYTGKPCKHGHVAERYVKNRICTGCRDNVKAAYYVKLGRTKPAGRYRTYRDSSSGRRLEFALTLEEFKEFWQKPCAYCGDPIETIGLDRMDNSKGYTFDNICSCCWSCNNMKGKYNKDEWIKILTRIVTLTL